MLGVILAVLLAVSMLPAAGLASAFADEPVARPETVDGDVALEGTSGTSAVAGQALEDGMVVAEGLVYTVTDGGLSLVGFDGLPQGGDAPKEIVVPEAVSADGKDTPVAAVAIAEGNVAEGVISLTLPQSVDNVDIATLAAAFPNLASVEVASPKASSTPVAAGAAAMKAAYSSFAGILYKNIHSASEDGAEAASFAKELVWAPPATVVARIPAECASIAPGAFASCKDLKTVVCFGVMGEIPQAKKAEDGTVVPGAFTDEQIATVNVIVPQTGTVVPDPDGGRVSADVAVTDHSTMDIKREAWWKSGFASDRITLGEVYGSMTNTLPVTEEGVLVTSEAEVAYAPETTQNYSSRKAGIKPPESAIPTPVPDDDELDPSESGLVFTHLADMTLSVRWKGDPTATPAHLDIPAYATINGVTYPVTEIAPEAFKGAVFLTSVTVPEGITTIGDFAFEGCTNLSETGPPSNLRGTTDATPIEASTPLTSSEESGTNHTTSSQSGLPFVAAEDAPMPAETTVQAFDDSTISPYSDLVTTKFYVSCVADGISNLKTINVPSTENLEAGLALLELNTYIFDFNVVDIRPWTQNYDWWMVEYQYRYNGADTISSGIFYLGWGNSRYRIASVGYSDMVMWSTIRGDVKVGNIVLDVVPRSIYEADSHVTQNAINSALGDLGGSSVKAHLDNKANVGHTHDDRYYTESETNSLLGGKSDVGHTHDDRYYTESEVDTKLSSYVTTTAINSALGELGGQSVRSLLDMKADIGHDHDGRYYTESEVDDALGAAKKEAADATAALDAATVKSSEFGVIEYKGLDGADANVYTTSYRKGGMPSIHEPEREGYDFAGWTWERGDASGGSGNLAEAFAAAGEVVLTATWAQEAPKGTYFFTERDPLAKAGPAPQEHVIKVVMTRTRSYPVDRVEFSWDNWTGLIAEGASITLTVGTEYDEATGEIKGGKSCTLARDAAGANKASIEGLNMVPVQFASRQCGLYVGISVPEGAVDKVVESYTEGSYVDSLVKMSYALAA